MKNYPNKWPLFKTDFISKSIAALKWARDVTKPNLANAETMGLGKHIKGFLSKSGYYTKLDITLQCQMSPSIEIDWILWRTLFQSSVFSSLRIQCRKWNLYMVLIVVVSSTYNTGVRFPTSLWVFSLAVCPNPVYLSLLHFRPALSKGWFNRHSTNLFAYSCTCMYWFCDWWKGERRWMKSKKRRE